MGGTYRKAILLGAALIVLFVALNYMGSALYHRAAGITTVKPFSGVALAILLIAGRRSLWPVLIAGYLGGVFAKQMFGASLYDSLLTPLWASGSLYVTWLLVGRIMGGVEFRAWRQREAPAAAAPLEDGPAVIARRDGASLNLQLNRPANRNAMTVEMRDALCEALQLAAMDTSIEQVRIDARGKCFSTGGDPREFGSAPDPATAHLVRSLALPGRWLAGIAARTEAVVHGACIGSGIEFPAFAGRLVAAADAWFQLPELKYGLIPGAGGCVSITRRIGRQRCAWLALSGRRLGAAEARAWGLIDAIAAAA